MIGNYPYFLNSIGSIIITIFFLIPFFFLLKTLIKNLNENKITSRSMFLYLILCAFSIVIIISIWTAFSGGNKLETTPKEEEGVYQEINNGPEEKTKEEKEIEEENWKSESQKTMELNLRNQKDPNEIMREAIKRTQK